MANMWVSDLHVLDMVSISDLIESEHLRISIQDDADEENLELPSMAEVQFVQKDRQDDNLRHVHIKCTALDEDGDQVPFFSVAIVPADVRVNGKVFTR